MRIAGVTAFEYSSARDPEKGINVALFSPQAFSKTTPGWQQAYSFDQTSFLLGRELPQPAL